MESMPDEVRAAVRENGCRNVTLLTQAPNGNFAFNFFISLIAEPNLKFNYDRRTYRPQPTTQ